MGILIVSGYLFVKQNNNKLNMTHKLAGTFVANRNIIYGFVCRLTD